jgi:hypothetical protein
LGRTEVFAMKRPALLSRTKASKTVGLISRVCGVFMKDGKIYKNTAGG